MHFLELTRISFLLPSNSYGKVSDLTKKLLKFYVSIRWRKATAKIMNGIGWRARCRARHVGEQEQNKNSPLPEKNNNNKQGVGAFSCRAYFRTPRVFLHCAYRVRCTWAKRNKKKISFRKIARKIK